MPQPRKPTRQTSLAFGRSPRITKPLPASISKAKSFSLDRATPAKKDELKIETEVVEPGFEEVNGISEVQVKEYYGKKILNTRKCAPVHQNDIPLPEKILRHFDMSEQYGPCIGITRLQRWKRAQGLELSPPVEVLAVLKEVEGEERKKDGWREGEVKRRDTRRAYLQDYLATL